jgi:transposase
MDHVAIDLGGRESQICVRSSDGAIVEEERRGTRSLGKYLARRAKSRVVMETCSEAFAVAEEARDAGHEVVVVPAMLVRSLGVGHRGIKTDVRDARNLSEASCRMEKLPGVHIPSREARERKAMCSAREALVQVRTKLINAVRGWTRSQGLGTVRSGAPTTFPTRVRELATTQGKAIPKYVERALSSLEHLTLQIIDADHELEDIAKSDPTCKLLMTAPGVGPASAVRFVAAVDAVDRFPDAHRLQSYIGLTPGEKSSSDKKQRTGLTKAGAVKVRWLFIQAAWAARRYYKNDPVVQWSMEVERRRGKHVAVAALARRLVGILYAMWRDNRAYDPRHGVRLLPS